MVKVLALILLLLLVNSNSYSQENTDNLSFHNKVVSEIEDYILAGKFDSAAYLISQQKPSVYLNRLSRISEKKNPTYNDFQKFISRLENRNDIFYLTVSEYINSNIEEPKNNTDINLDYVNIKWNQISKLRDEETIEEASEVQTKLEDYIDKFNPRDKNTVKAQILSSTHQIVLYNIQKEVEKGKKLCLDNFELAKGLNDKKLMIISLYYLCDFLILEGKLDEYIKVCEQSLDIENTLENRSSYYVGTLVHAIDAYIYKGGKEKRVQSLLAELYNDPVARSQSFSLYAKYLGTLELDGAIAKEIFKQFEVTSLIEFCDKTEKIGSKSLNPNDLYQLIREIAFTLERQRFLEAAIAYKDKTVVLIKKIYSQDLANSLASFKTNEAVKEKDLEIKLQNERTQFYIVIASLIAVLLLLFILAFFRKQKQSKILESKNEQIEKALKEKELLVREVHHRVKNNFQIVSSLLELQSKGIEDKKARMLANEGQNRVKSMALIHQKLYQNEDGLIDFDEYIHLLVKELTSLNTSEINVETKVVAHNMRFDVDTAIPLGLIINELITNAYKYAFVVNRVGELNISINQIDKENYKLEVSDNGLGLDKEININKVKSLGLRLVTRLVKQLQGTLILTNSEGAKFEIIFKDIHARRKIY